MFLVLTLLTGVAYPGVVTLAAKALFKRQAEGSLVRHRFSQLAAQGGVRIEIRPIGSVHEETISLQPGLPKAGGL